MARRSGAERTVCRWDGARQRAGRRGRLAGREALGRLQINVCARSLSGGDERKGPGGRRGLIIRAPADWCVAAMRGLAPARGGAAARAHKSRRSLQHFAAARS